MVLTGVATDCCVLSTALGALDAGRFVTVVSDACAAVSDEAQQQTLALLQLLSPMCEVVTSRELLARTTPAERT
jgi:nicotinamidase-related amidase